jgi:two-component system, sensor histidine kinase
MVRVSSKKKSAGRRPRRSRSLRKQRDREIVLAAFAHDIRTSLTGILALGDLLASSALGDSERRWTTAIKAGAEHLAALTTLAIDAAKVGTGQIILQTESFRPRRLFESLAESLTARAETKGLDAKARIANEPPELLIGDPVRLRAAVENLIDNAVKFTERGIVRLEMRTEPAPRGRVKLAVTVRDSGIGMNKAEIKRLFHPFVQASADIARRYGGSGLGLAVVKSLAKLMGGDLTVTSAPGQGSSFHLTALLAVAPAGSAAEVSAKLAASSTPPLAILCAEDNPYGRVILNTILTELGHRADFVGSGQEAVAAVTRGYDLILMDITLPGMDGRQAARRIRSLAGAGARIPIIGISGRAEADDEQMARAAGIDSYLRKPVSPMTLREAIAAVLPPSKSATRSAEG